jgi:hypothetical protein
MEAGRGGEDLGERKAKQDVSLPFQPPPHQLDKVIHLGVYAFSVLNNRPHLFL